MEKWTPKRCYVNHNNNDDDNDDKKLWWWWQWWWWWWSPDDDYLMMWHYHDDGVHWELSECRRCLVNRNEWHYVNTCIRILR